MRNATKTGKNIGIIKGRENNNDELKRLLVHGILHLNGMDHGEEHIEKGVTPVCEMLQKQEKILELLKEEKIIK